MGVFDKLLSKLQARANALSSAQPPAPAAPDSLAGERGDWQVRGNAALARGELQEAESCYLRGLQASPGSASLLLNLGFVQIESGRADAAVETLHRSLAAAGPGDARHEIHFILGQACEALGQVDEALAAHDAAIALAPTFAPALSARAHLLMASPRREEALEAAARWATADPGAKSIVLLAQARYQLQLYAEALQALDEVVANEPGYVPAIEGRGHLFLRTGRFEEAVVAFHRAIALGGPTASRLAALGAAQQKSGRLDDADQTLTKGREQFPGDIELACNLANLRTQQLRLDEAVAIADEALRAHPQDGDVRFNRALALLTAGRMREGFADFEGRWQRGFDAPALPFPGVPRWTGEPLQGRTLVVFGEQGLGDTIQFMRYVPALEAQGARVLVQVAASLRALWRDSDIGGELIDAAVPGVVAVKTDFQCALESLSHVLDLVTADAPGLATPPYLRANPARIAAWRQRIARPGAALRVGVVWAGNPQHTNDRNRSIPLAQFRHIAAPGVTFVGLNPQQRASDEAALAEWRDLLNLGPALTDFADTAALIAALDLVVTIDTSIAHLAGAMGKEVWVLLPHAPDWRWMLGRTDSPWYPSMRLVRQAVPGDWRDTLQGVRRELLQRSQH